MSATKKTETFQGEDERYSLEIRPVSSSANSGWPYVTATSTQRSKKRHTVENLDSSTIAAAADIIMARNSSSTVFNGLAHDDSDGKNENRDAAVVQPDDDDKKEVFEIKQVNKRSSLRASHSSVSLKVTAIDGSEHNLAKRRRVSTTTKSLKCREMSLDQNLAAMSAHFSYNDDDDDDDDGGGGGGGGGGEAFNGWKKSSLLPFLPHLTTTTTTTKTSRSLPSTAPMEIPAAVSASYSFQQDLNDIKCLQTTQEASNNCGKTSPSTASTCSSKSLSCNSLQQQQGNDFGWFVDTDDDNGTDHYDYMRGPGDSYSQQHVQGSTSLAFIFPLAPRVSTKDQQREEQWAAAADIVDDVLGDFF